jgi:hypothetical protein
VRYGIGAGKSDDGSQGNQTWGCLHSKNVTQGEQRCHEKQLDAALDGEGSIFTPASMGRWTWLGMGGNEREGGRTGTMLFLLIYLSP